MILKDGTVVRRLKDRHNTGYAGFGYGGDKLFVVCLVDCFDPPRYLVRADSFEQAYDTARECLSETLDPGEATEAAANGWLDWSPSGRPVSDDDDIRIWQIAGPESH